MIICNHPKGCKEQVLMEVDPNSESKITYRDKKKKRVSIISKSSIPVKSGLCYYHEKVRLGLIPWIAKKPFSSPVFWRSRL